MKQRSLITLLTLIMACFSFGGNLVAQSDEDRPFRDAEPIDIELLRHQLNLKMGESLQELGLNLVCNDTVVSAANYSLTHPGEATTDADGFHIPYARMVLQKEGKDAFLIDMNSGAKTNCGSIRNFDETDTYGEIAARFVKGHLNGNKGTYESPGFKNFGVGAAVIDRYERINDIEQTDQPKVKWINVLFLVTY